MFVLNIYWTSYDKMKVERKMLWKWKEIVERDNNWYGINIERADDEGKAWDTSITSRYKNLMF